MTKDELVERLRDIEWDDFEAKTAKSDLPKNIWETVSAFSNCSGCWIVLGVKQSGRLFEVTGVDNIEKLEQDFFGTLRSKKFNVPLFATPSRYEVDGKNILTFYIPSSEVKPVYFGSLENTFIRMGSGDQRATQQEIMSMVRDQSFGIQSQKSIPDTNIDMLNRDALTDFRGEVRHWGLVSHLDSVSDEEFCKGVGITIGLQTRNDDKNDVGVNVGVNVGVKLSDIQTKVVELIKDNPSITHAEIARVLSITQRTVERTTKKLRELRIISREGSDKTGIWKILVS